MQVILLALTCLLICQGATKKQSWIGVIFFINKAFTLLYVITI